MQIYEHCLLQKNFTQYAPAHTNTLFFATTLISTRFRLIIPMFRNIHQNIWVTWNICGNCESVDTSISANMLILQTYLEASR